MKLSIEEIYNKILEEPIINQVYEVFKNYYGEDYVDLQKNPSIIEEINMYLAIKGIHPIDSKLVIKAESTTVDPNTLSSNDFEKIYFYDLEDAFIEHIKSRLSGLAIVYIYVWWPTVTVSNENNRSIEIWDLYARVPITIEGYIPYESRGFELNRTTYDEVQFYNGYLHSHIKTIPTSDFTTFMLPCLGRGPIKDTIITLKSSCDTYIWMLYCEELNRFVSVESLTGGPWKKLENLNNGERLYNDYSIYDSLQIEPFRELFSIEYLRDFTKYYLQNGHFKLNYVNSQYICNMSHDSFLIDISCSFIDWYNKQPSVPIDSTILFKRGLLKRAIVKDGYLCTIQEPYAPMSNIENKYVLTFKGQKKYLKINKNEQTLNTCIILKDSIALFILHNILEIINLKYTNNNGITNQNSRNTETSSSSSKRVCCL